MSSIIKHEDPEVRVLNLVLDLNFLHKLILEISYPNLNSLLNFIFTLVAVVPEMKTKITRTVLYDLIKNFIELDAVDIMRLDIHDRRLYEIIFKNRDQLNMKQEKLKDDFEKKKSKLKLDRSPKVKSKSQLDEKFKKSKVDAKVKSKKSKSDSKVKKCKPGKKSKISSKSASDSDDILHQLSVEYRTATKELERDNLEIMKELYRQDEEQRYKIMCKKTNPIIDEFMLKLENINVEQVNHLPITIKTVSILPDLDLILIIFLEDHPHIYDKFVKDEDFLSLKNVLDTDIILNNNENFVRLLSNFVLLENRKISSGTSNLHLKVQDYIRSGLNPDFSDKIYTYLT